MLLQDPNSHSHFAQCTQSYTAFTCIYTLCINIVYVSVYVFIFIKPVPDESDTVPVADSRFCCIGAFFLQCFRFEFTFHFAENAPKEPTTTYPTEAQHLTLPPRLTPPSIETKSSTERTCRSQSSLKLSRERLGCAALVRLGPSRLNPIPPATFYPTAALTESSSPLVSAAFRAHIIKTSSWSFAVSTFCCCSALTNPRVFTVGHSPRGK